MITIKRIWNLERCLAANELVLVRDDAVIVRKEEGSCREGDREEIFLDEDEFIIDSILTDQIEKDVKTLTNTQLVTAYCIAKGLFSEADLEKRIEALYHEIGTISEEDILPRAVPTMPQLVFQMKDEQGNITDEGQKRIEEFAARTLLFNYLCKTERAWEESTREEQLAVADFYDIIDSIVASLIGKKRFWSGVHPINEEETAFFLPQKMLLVRLGNRWCRQAEKSAVLTGLHKEFPDVVGKTKGLMEELHERHPDNTLDFNLLAPTSGGICVTHDCQLRCQFGSFSSGECKPGMAETVRFESAKAFVDMLIQNSVKQKRIAKQPAPIDIVIAGGGEPTFKWDTFVSIVEYIRQATQKQGISCRLGITTNGCHSEEQTEFIIKNFNQIMISFDGLPETQNRNRPFSGGSASFDVVDATIRRLDEKHANYTLLSVVQPEDFPKMRDMALFVFQRYPNVRAWTARPPIAVGRARKNGSYGMPEPGSFADRYFEALQSLGYPRKMNAGIFSWRVVESFCGALYGMHPWLLPNNTIVTCQDAQDEAVVIGEVCDGVVSLKTNRDIYAAKSFSDQEKCKNCFVYEFCHGDCPRKDLSPEMEMYSIWKCNEVRRYWQRVLAYLLSTGSYDGMYLENLEVKNLTEVYVWEVRSDR